MNNKVVVVLIVLVLVVGGFLLFKNSSVAPTESELELGMPVPGSNVDETIVKEEETTSNVTSPAIVKEFSVDATSFAFAPKTMTVNKGDTVKITVTNTGGTHDLKIDEFVGASTRILKNGEVQTITFVADKSGTFEYYCSVGQHRSMGMVGTLTVR